MLGLCSGYDIFFLMLETEESVDSHHILQEAPDRVIKRSPGNLSSQIHRLVTLEVLNLIYLIYKALSRGKVRIKLLLHM